MMVDFIPKGTVQRTVQGTVQSKGAGIGLKVRPRVRTKGED